MSINIEIECIPSLDEIKTGDTFTIQGDHELIKDWKYWLSFTLYKRRGGLTQYKVVKIY